MIMYKLWSRVKSMRERSNGLCREMDKMMPAGRRRLRKGRLQEEMAGEMKIAVLGFLMSLAAYWVIGLPVQAEVMYTNEETGYQVCIEDDADLLSQEEESALAQQLRGITVYGNALFKSIDENNYSTDSYARAYYQECFGNSSGSGHSF